MIEMLDRISRLYTDLLRIKAYGAQKLPHARSDICVSIPKCHARVQLPASTACTPSGIVGCRLQHCGRIRGRHLHAAFAQDAAPRALPHTAQEEAPGPPAGGG